MPNKNSIEALLNSAKARKRPGVDRKIKLTTENEAIARQLGNGSITDGIDKIFEPIKLLLSNTPNSKEQADLALQQLINLLEVK